MEVDPFTSKTVINFNISFIFSQSDEDKSEERIDKINYTKSHK